MDITTTLLSVQRALFHSVTSNLRAVYINIINNCVHIMFYYDNPPSEEEQELAMCAETEVISDFSSIEYKSNLQFITLPYPNPIPHKGVCVYKRYEEMNNENK